MAVTANNAATAGGIPTCRCVPCFSLMSPEPLVGIIMGLEEAKDMGNNFFEEALNVSIFS